MARSTEALNQIAEAIERRKLAIFCGAGVSLASGIPLAGTIRTELLRALGAQSHEMDRLNQTRMPFEAFMGHILNDLDRSQREALFGIFACGRPTTNHYFIAKLLGARFVRFVFTTNFDTHIEEAFKELQAEAAEKELAAHHSADGLWSAADGGAHLFKLHGTIDDPENLGLTLRAICERKALDQRQKLVEQIFSADSGAEALLILGYSFSDLYDVISGIQRVGGKRKTLFVVQHIEDDDTLDDSQWRVKQLESIPVLANYDGFCLHAPTPRIVAWLTARFVSGIPTADLSHELGGNVRQWCNRLCFGHRASGLLSGLLFQVSAHSEALSRAMEFSSLAHADEDILLARALIEAAQGRMREDEWPIATPEQSVEHARLAETLATKGGRDNLAVSAVMENWVGMQIRRVGYPARALPYHLRALERAIEAGAKDTEALCLLDISATLGAMGDQANSPELFLGAIDAATRALCIYEDMESPFHQGRCFMNLGNAMHALSDYEGAEEAFALAQKYLADCGVSWHKAYFARKLEEVRRRWGARFHGVSDARLDEAKQALRLASGS